MLSGDVCPVAVRVWIAVEEMGDDLLIFDTRSQRAHSLNAAASAVWKACDGEHTPAQLAARLAFDEDPVRLALRSLSDCDLLQAPVLAEGFVSRRALLRRLAFAGAGAAGHRVASTRRIAHRATRRDNVSTAPWTNPVLDSRLACSSQFLAGSAERPSWTQLGGHSAARIADPGERNQAPVHDQDGRDRVRHAERMHRRIAEG
jgi:hypothetical protein